MAAAAFNLNLRETSLFDAPDHIAAVGHTKADSDFDLGGGGGAAAERASAKVRAKVQRWSSFTCCSLRRRRIVQQVGRRRSCESDEAIGGRPVGCS